MKDLLAMKKSLVALSILVAATTLSACETTTSDGGSDASQAAPKKNAVPVVAATMIKEFEDDERTADKKYKGKAVKVTGIVKKIDTELFDENDYTVELGGRGQYEILSVTAYDVPDKQLDTIKKGQEVTLTCDFKDGGDLGIELNHCRKS